MVVSDFHVFIRDVLQHVDAVQKDYPGLPVFLLGHSMVRRPQRARASAPGVRPAADGGSSSAHAVRGLPGVFAQETGWGRRLEAAPEEGFSTHSSPSGRGSLCSHFLGWGPSVRASCWFQSHAVPTRTGVPRKQSLKAIPNPFCLLNTQTPLRIFKSSVNFKSSVVFKSSCDL